MKRVFIVFFLSILAGFGIFYYQETSICRNQLFYDIGDFDNQFGIAREKFLRTIEEAELVWEQGVGQELFGYRTGAKFKINLVFDERQAETLEANRSKEEIELSRSSYDDLLEQYKNFERSYQASLLSYDQDVINFEKRLQYYNARVSEANSKGGATPAEYKELQEEKNNLEDYRRKLDQERSSLNLKAAELNSLGDHLNEMAKKLNINVDTHNQRFGEAREFDQGEYYNGRINIYQFDRVSDLKLVLAHELGHALRIEHVENPKSIMYYLMEKQDPNNPVLSKEDIAAFNERCDFNPSRLFPRILQFLY